MQVIQVLVFLACLWMYHGTATIKTSKQPVILNLKRWVPLPAPNDSSLTVVDSVKRPKPARSKPLLFQQVLGLTPGTDFDFNVEKWRALQSCGLFQNLTARTIVKDDGIALLIEGTEGPSLKFAPEISVGGSVTDPQVSGGLIFVDRNLRGLGDSLEVFVSKKEGIDESLDTLGANWRISWKDCPIGKNFRAFLEIEHENNIDLMANFLPLPNLPKEEKGKLEQFFGWKSPISQNNIKLSTVKEVYRTAESVVTWTFEPFHHSIHIPSIDDLIHPVRCSGARVKLNHHSLDGDNVMKYTLSYETGRTSFPIPSLQKDWQPYHHASLDLSFPTIRTEFGGFWRKLPFVSSSSGGRPLSLLHRFKINCFETWGKGGVSSYHGRSLPNSQIVRGFPANLARAHNSVRSLLNLKWDTYVENFPFGKFGFFSDAALYEEQREEIGTKEKMKFASSLQKVFVSMLEYQLILGRHQGYTWD
eukprot:gene13335-14650_t